MGRGVSSPAPQPRRPCSRGGHAAWQGNAASAQHAAGTGWAFSPCLFFLFLRCECVYNQNKQDTMSTKLKISWNDRICNITKGNSFTWYITRKSNPPQRFWGRAYGKHVKVLCPLSTTKPPNTGVNSEQRCAATCTPHQRALRTQGNVKIQWFLWNWFKSDTARGLRVLSEFSYVILCYFTEKKWQSFWLLAISSSVKKQGSDVTSNKAERDHAIFLPKQ